jgi:hypothetical protein
VGYVAADKLCLDGQRLIQTDDAGSPLPFPQVNDALGRGAGAYAEYRTEKDSFARVRAYGHANGDTTGASGPAYFRVWTKAGQVYEYGDGPAKDSNTRALVSPTGKNVAWGSNADDTSCSSCSTTDQAQAPSCDVRESRRFFRDGDFR